VTKGTHQKKVDALLTDVTGALKVGGKKRGVVEVGCISKKPKSICGYMGLMSGC